MTLFFWLDYVEQFTNQWGFRTSATVSCWRTSPELDPSFASCIPNRRHTSTRTCFRRRHRRQCRRCRRTSAVRLGCVWGFRRVGRRPCDSKWRTPRWTCSRSCLRVVVLLSTENNYCFTRFTGSDLKVIVLNGYRLGLVWIDSREGRAAIDPAIGRVVTTVFVLLVNAQHWFTLCCNSRRDVLSQTEEDDVRMSSVLTSCRVARAQSWSCCLAGSSELWMRLMLPFPKPLHFVIHDHRYKTHSKNHDLRRQKVKRHSAKQARRLWGTYSKQKHLLPW